MQRPSGKQLSWVINHRQLMAESEALIHYAADAGSNLQKSVLSQLVDNPRGYSSWEHYHASLMQKVADSGTVPGQICQLREHVLSLLHTGALTRVLVRRTLSEENRTILLKRFHPHKDSEEATCVENTSYVRAEASSMCARYLAIRLGDVSPPDWFEDYFKVYNDYFEMFCRSILAEEKHYSDPLNLFLEEAKARVKQCRREVLNVTVQSRLQSNTGSSPGSRHQRPRSGATA